MEFLEEEGFFFKLRFRSFRADLAPRALAAIRANMIGTDHAENYKLLHMLFGAESDLSAYSKAFPADELFEQWFGELFEAISLRFEEARMLAESLTGGHD